jgi:hypothetical protein
VGYGGNRKSKMLHLAPCCAKLLAFSLGIPSAKVKAMLVNLLLSRRNEA